MGSNMFLSYWLSGLRHSSTGACRLLDRAKSWCQNGDLCESSYQSILSRTTASSVRAPSSLICGQPSPPQETLQDSQGGLAQPLLLCVDPSVCEPSKSGVSVSPSPAELLHPSPLFFKAKCSGGFHLLMPHPQPQEPKMGLRTFTLAREPLQYNYFAVCGSLTHDVTKASLLCLFWLLLCLWM